MIERSLQEKLKSRIGPKDFKRSSRAKRATDRAIKLIFAFMLSSIAFMISF